MICEIVLRYSRSCGAGAILLCTLFSLFYIETKGQSNYAMMYYATLRYEVLCSALSQLI
jgi:hypothetical protein